MTQAELSARNHLDAGLAGHAGTTDAPGPIARLLARLRGHLETNRRYRQTVAELEMLSDRDLADIGLARHDIDDVAARMTRR